MDKRLKQIILFGGDIGILFLTLLLSLMLRFLSPHISAVWAHNAPYFIPIFIIWLFVFYIGGVYRLDLAYNRRRFRSKAINLTVIAALISIIYFYLSESDIAPKTILAIFTGVFLILFVAWRSLFYFLAKSYLPKNNLAFIGWNRSVESLIEDLKQQPHHGFNTALVFKTVAEINNLPALVKEKNIRTIVVEEGVANNQQLIQDLFDCLPLGVSFYNFVDFYENINGKIPLEAIGQAWFIDNLDEGRRGYFNLIKRISDFILAALIFIISLVFWPFIALAIKLSSRGPVFFTQERVGQNEKVFQMLKFRTMKVQGNDGSMTKEHDNRITGVGRFLRKTRLDEIPQLINILRGEMSFIGPRPERPEYVRDLAEKIPFYKTRLLIQPGISGWDQISGVYHSPSLEDTTEKLQYDLYYLKHRSIIFDCSIFLKTIATMLGREGR